MIENPEQSPEQPIDGDFEDGAGNDQPAVESVVKRVKEPMISPSEVSGRDDERKLVRNVYYALIVSMVLQFVPTSAPQIVSLALFFIIWAVALYVRWKSPDDYFTHEHMTYINGTIWMTTFVITLGGLIGGYYVYMHGDNAAFLPLADKVGAGNIITDDDMHAAMIKYFHNNVDLIMVASVVTLGPGIVYLCYRLWRGFSLANVGLLMEKPKGWF